MAKKRGPARAGQAFEIWQVGAARLPMWTTRSDGEIVQAWMAVCARRGPKPFMLSEPGPEESIPDLLASAVASALQIWRTRPRRVQVPDPAWVPPLESALAPRGVAVEVEPDLPLLRELLEVLPRRLAEQDPRPGALTGEGVTPDRLAALARAAAGLLAASAWRHLNNEDLIRVEAPDAGEELRFFNISHRGGRSAPDLTFFSNPEAFEVAFDEDGEESWDDEPELDDDDLLDAGVDDLEAAEGIWGPGLWSVELLPSWAAPFVDVELWRNHGLPWAGEGFLPVAVLADRGALHRPDRRQLAFFEGLFAALAATSEEDLDAGRWEKRVSTAEGEARFVLSLPGLLEPREEPPAAPEPALVLRELERSLRRMGAAPPDEASAQARAEELLERAFRARGRRGVSSPARPWRSGRTAPTLTASSPAALPTSNPPPGSTSWGWPPGSGRWAPAPSRTPVTSGAWWKPGHTCGPAPGWPESWWNRTASGRPWSTTRSSCASTHTTTRGFAIPWSTC